MSAGREIMNCCAYAAIVAVICRVYCDQPVINFQSASKHDVDTV